MDLKLSWNINVEFGMIHLESIS